MRHWAISGCMREKYGENASVKRKEMEYSEWVSCARCLSTSRSSHPQQYTVCIGRCPSAHLGMLLSGMEADRLINTADTTAYGHMGKLGGLGISRQSTSHLKQTNWTHIDRTNDSTAIAKQQSCAYPVCRFNSETEIASLCLYTGSTHLFFFLCGDCYFVLLCLLYESLYERLN